MTLEERLEQIGGCSDGNCQVHRRPGMHTNGGCRCFVRNDGITAQRVVYAYKAEIERLKAENMKMRDALVDIRRIESDQTYRAGFALELIGNLASRALKESEQ